MAEVKNVVLTVSNVPNLPDKKNVMVSYTLQFEPAEAGKQFQVVINLMGDDGGNDTTLHTFWFGLKRYALVTAQAGAQNFTETRQLTTGTLNEDPGHHVIEVDINTTIKIPHDDELYATVNVGQVGRSNTLKMIL